jgi:hypothetical protein
VSFEVAVKRTLEWSKKYFEQRRTTFSEIGGKSRVGTNAIKPGSGAY